MRTFFASLLIIPALAGHVARAADPATCSDSTFGNGSSDPPSGRVAVTIHSLRLNDDMELDVWPFDNRADVYGVVEINANGTWEQFNLPELEGTDFPHWNTGNKFISAPATPGVPVQVVIRMRENDLPFNDVVDTSPDTAADDLQLFFDTCSQRISGDVTGSAAQPLAIDSGNGSNQGTLIIEVKMEDSRPLSNTANDVALTGFDLVQVLPNATRLIADKPTVALTTVVNNAPVPTDVSVRVRVRETGGGTDLYDVTESLGTMFPGEVRSTYLGQTSPFLPPRASCGSYDLTASATLILTPNFEPPVFSPQCWTINNSSSISQKQTVVTENPEILWQPTGFYFRNGLTASNAEVAAIHDLSLPLIRGAYPVANVTDSISLFPFSPAPPEALLRLVTILTLGLGIVQELFYPIILEIDLNFAAAMSGHDHVLGVLPPHWFDEPLFGAWSGPIGLSLGEWMTYAVIFEAESNDAAGNIGPAMTAPAHELGHTFGLSVDPTIKGASCSLNSWIGDIACALFGGLDELSSTTHPNGIPTWGFWIPQGPAAPPGITGEQCDSKCLMGTGPLNAHLQWNTERRWIDGADYDHLIDRLHKTCLGTTSPVAFVSGFVYENDDAGFTSMFRRPGELRAPDFSTTPGDVPAAYGLRFVDSLGTVLSESEVPLNWTHPHSPFGVLPVTIFGGFAEYPAGTAKIELTSRMSGKILASQTVSANQPVLGAPGVKISTSSTGARSLHVDWTASDADQDSMTHYVQLTPVRRSTFWPIAHGLSVPEAEIEIPADLGSGSYVLRVLSSDGVHLIHRDVTIQL